MQPQLLARKSVRLGTLNARELFPTASDQEAGLGMVDDCGDRLCFPATCLRARHVYSRTTTLPPRPKSAKTRGPQARPRVETSVKADV